MEVHGRCKQPGLPSACVRKARAVCSASGHRELIYCSLIHTKGELSQGLMNNPFGSYCKGTTQTAFVQHTEHGDKRLFSSKVSSASLMEKQMNAASLHSSGRVPGQCRL